MANSYFCFKQFTIYQDRCAMKVTTDGCLFGAWAAGEVRETKSRESGEASRLLDIGTGTGLLALMIAQSNPGLQIDAIEMDEAAAKQAAENTANSPWGRNISILQADAKKATYAHKYDYIISNPPFYENELKGHNRKKNMAHHNEGLLLPELLTIIKNNLKPEGSFYLLLPFKRNDEIRNLLLEHEFDISKILLVKQSIKHDFFRIMLSGKLQPDETTETVFDEIAIRDEREKYTDEFTRLLGGYYLKL